MCAYVLSIVALGFQQKKGGGLAFNSMCQLTKCNEKLIQLILHEYSILGGKITYILS